MVDYCSVCGKKLGLLSFKYKSEDGSVMCVSCLKEHKTKQDELKRQEEQRKQEAEESKRQEKFRERKKLRKTEKIELKKQEELRKTEELEEHEKHRGIIREYSSNYLTNKDTEILVLIRRICCEAYWIESFLERNKKYLVGDNPQAINRAVIDKTIKERPECVDYTKSLINSYETPYYIIEQSQDFISACISEYQYAIDSLESSKESGLSSPELEEITGDIKLWKIILNFLNDLEKLGRVFKKKGIETTPFEMLSIFFEVIREIANKEQNMPEQEQDKILDQWHEGISKIIRESEEDITKESVIRVWLMSWMETESEEDVQYLAEDVKAVSRLLKKFDFICEEEEAEQLIEQVKEEIELAVFEANLETSPQEISNVEREMIEKNKEIMRDYISKYLANKDQEYIDYILDVIDECIDSEILGDSEVLDVIEEYNPDLHFHEDLEKFYNLFKKKGIETNYSEILSIFAECIVDRAHEGIHEALEELDKYLNPMAKAFSMKFGEDITVENVIKEAMRKRPDICDNFSTITHFLGKFPLDYEEEEVKQLMEQTKEEIELKEFEKNLGTPPQKKMVENVINDLESGSEESGSFLSQELSFKEAEEVQNITLRCPCCEKEFDYQVNVTEEGTYLEAGTTHEIETECPYCGLPIGISLNVPSKPWTCRACGKQFETKAAAEEHEQTCEGRREKE